MDMLKSETVESSICYGILESHRVFLRGIFIADRMADRMAERLAVFLNSYKACETFSDLLLLCVE